jgi:ABC-type methionine transport system permease subunit
LNIRKDAEALGIPSAQAPAVLLDGQVVLTGPIGAGGIGATLNTAFDRYEFDIAAAIIITIIAIVMLVEYSSGLIRARLK